MTSKRRKPCGCKGSSGRPKERYLSQRQAASAHIRQGRRGPFRTYPCPRVKGVWHLTHA